MLDQVLLRTGDTGADQPIRRNRLNLFIWGIITTFSGFAKSCGRKSLILTISLGALCFFSTNAQDFQSVISNRIAYYAGEYGYIHCIRIDSVKSNPDSVLYPFTEIQQQSYDCFSPYEASWIGKSITIRNNGENLFINREKDTIRINTLADKGEKWIAWTLKDSICIEAEITGVDTMHFLGLTDSVKTVGFQAYDRNMAPVSHHINGMNISISKKYGFVKTFNFYLFPDLLQEIFYDECQEYRLVGLSSPESGVQNLSWLDVHDFQVGDELHILEESSCWESDNNYYLDEIKTIYRYLERSDYPDSVRYKYARIHGKHQTMPDKTTYTFISDTLTSTYKADSLFDLLPGEPVFSGSELYRYSMLNTDPVSKLSQRAYESFMSSGDSCWSMLIGDGCLAVYSYIKGLGGPYYSCTHAFCLGGAERTLVYYKKGDVTRGSPLKITGISPKKIDNDILVFPNPAEDFIDIHMVSNTPSGRIIIYDINGRQVFSGALEPRNTRCDISDLSPGSYILKIITENETVAIQKLIVR